MRERTTQFVLLGILAEAGPSTGYDVKQWIEQAIGHFWSESFGQIYPELHRLTETGLIERVDESEGSRDQKRYRITPAGRDVLAAWLAKAPRPDLRRSELLLKLFFGRFGDAASARDWLGEAWRAAAAKLAYFDRAGRQMIDEDRHSPSLPFSLISLDAGRRAMRARMAWAETALRYLNLYERGGAEALIAAFEEDRP